jgi:hypothetical protein
MTNEKTSSNVFGWMLPNGQFFECGKFDHIRDVFQNKRLLSRLPDKLQKSVIELDEIYDSCLSIEEETGAGEWHTYEMACGDVRTEVWISLLRSGCVRVAGIDDRIHFEGIGDSLARIKSYADAFSESYGATSQFDRVSVSTK